MLILAISTSSKICSVALLEDDKILNMIDNSLYMWKSKIIKFQVLVQKR